MTTPNHNLHKKSCLYCGVEFFAPRIHYKFCSRLCSSRSVASHVKSTDPVLATTTCSWCGKEFNSRLSYAKNLQRRGQIAPKFCSRPCFNLSRRMLVRPDTKACSGCNRTLPYTAEFFSANSSKKNTFGLRARCRRCAADDVREKNKEYQRRLKVQVLTAYGGGRLACVCCGDTNIEFLTLDHIFGGGSAERKHTSSLKLYYKLRRLGFPQGEHRTLCFNCNFSYGHFGYCPHQLPASAGQNKPSHGSPTPPPSQPNPNPESDRSEPAPSSPGPRAG